MGTAAPPEVIWRPQPGPQTALLACPVEDVFYGGARGGGKTDGLLGDWLAHAGRYGAGARGIFFRRSYPELEEVERRARELFTPLGAREIAQKHTWFFTNGASLKMRYLERDKDAGKYQGHAYTWMAFDELTNWGAPRPDRPALELAPVRDRRTLHAALLRQPGRRRPQLGEGALHRPGAAVRAVHGAGPAGSP